MYLDNDVYSGQSSSSNSSSTPLAFQNDSSSDSEFLPQKDTFQNNYTELSMNDKNSNGASAGGTLGDIMSSSYQLDAANNVKDGLITKESQSLAKTYGIQNPLDRMAITANGNLQRLVSSYYDAPVTVQVEYCKRRNNLDAADSYFSSAGVAVWERRVLLQIFDQQTFCTADSIVVIHHPHVEELIESGAIGIGQLFRYFNILPEFALLAAGSNDGGGFWRNYTLTSEQLMTCHIHEVFCKDMWNLV
jgi:hypothetical protein